MKPKQLATWDAGTCQAAIYKTGLDHFRIVYRSYRSGTFHRQTITPPQALGHLRELGNNTLYRILKGGKP